MSSISQRLLSYRVPDVEQALNCTDTAFYALSIGFGQDPLNAAELAFVDPAPAMATVPSMALVLAYPGFWLGSSDLALDAAAIVHVQQEVTLHRPLPATGRVASRTRVTGVFDRGSGKGLAVCSERTLIDTASDSPLASLKQVHFLRGERCTEAPPYTAPASNVTPVEPPVSTVVLETRPEQALLYRLNGDMNSLHVDPDVASRAGFVRPILHGMCTFGIATRAVVAHLCAYRPERIQSVVMNFRAPVYPGESLKVDLWSCGAFQVRVVERELTLVASGQASVRAWSS